MVFICKKLSLSIFFAPWYGNRTLASCEAVSTLFIQWILKTGGGSVLIGGWRARQAQEDPRLQAPFYISISDQVSTVILSS